ncbi:hypothetical protein CsSME_00024542 [Camellia sinensis var. sinensis]
MSSSSGVLKGCRALMAAAKAATPKSSAAKPKPKPKTKPKPKPKPKPKAVSKSSSSSKMARPTGIFKLAPVSPALHQFLGVPEAARTDAVKKTWDYIKLHNLQYYNLHVLSCLSLVKPNPRDISLLMNLRD